MPGTPLIELLKGFARPHTRCRCCGALATLFGVVDFNKNCMIEKGKQVLPLCGLPVYYYRCAVCGVIFTTAFDGFAPDDFANHIYNAGYATVDPDYADARPAQKGEIAAGLFAGSKSIRVLDYGGGNGRLAEVMRAAGFGNVTTFDPFVPAFAARPEGRFDLILSFEVLEHTPTPRQTIADILSFMKDDGMLLFSTLLQPPDIDAVGGVNWWYVAPRNGHVTIYTKRSLERIANDAGCLFASADANLHAMFRRVPPFAAHLISGLPTGTG